MELKSIAFIPDGNRRYARKAKISMVEAYSLGTSKAWDVINWIKDYNKIKVGTFYTLSLENLSRSASELNILFKIFENELDKVQSTTFFEDNELKLKFIGRLDQFPKKLKEKMFAVEKRTENFSKKTINLALGYNGQAEIVDAAKKFAEQYKKGLLKLNDLTMDSFKSFLYAPFPEPDLIIRTSGTQRLSGFLTYQSSYSELYFSRKYWPEFSKTDLDDAITNFSERKRKFGK